MVYWYNQKIFSSFTFRGLFTWLQIKNDKLVPYIGHLHTVHTLTKFRMVYWYNKLLVNYWMVIYLPAD
jgi:hypothetical protein